MNTLKLSFTGSESLEIIKDYYPNTWQKRLEERITAIKWFAEGQKITLEFAFVQMLSKISDVAMIIELKATQYFMNLDNKLNEVETLKSKQLQIGLQLVALEANDYISFEDKKTLRAYYLKLQNDLQIQISKIIDTEISPENEKI